MADMITLLQLQDALATRKLVDARVLEVALRVAEITRDMTLSKEYDRSQWQMRYWRCDTGPWSEENKHREESSCDVDLEIHWFNRPKTDKYGDPEEDTRDEDLSHSGEYLKRRVSFPFRYLLTEGWESEVEEKARRHKAWLLNYQLPDRIKRHKQREQELAADYEKLKEDIAQNEANRTDGILE